MNASIKVFIGLLLLFGSIISTNAYELTQKDEEILFSIEEKLFPILDDKGAIITGKVLDRIDEIQETSINEEILTLLDRLELDMEEKYNIGTYAFAEGPTPILYTSYFELQFGGNDGVTLNFDGYGEIQAVEHIAVTGTVFSIIKDMGNNILQVTTQEYPASNELYVHSEFLSKTQREQPKQRMKNLSTEAEMIEKLRSFVGLDYVWGGNIPQGIPKLLEVFPPKSEISELTKQQWTLTGLDCSGLLYVISDGVTPRNTSSLVEYGERLDIAGKTLEEIMPMLEPLDVIVRKGHMMIVLDEENTIESAVSYSDTSLAPGVQIRKIAASLSEVIQTKAPVNNYGDVTGGQFVILRWYK